ncbi:MAG: alpha/beta hydrolase [Leucothrix sp.]
MDEVGIDLAMRIKTLAALLLLLFVTLTITGCANVKKTAAINALVPTEGFMRQQVSYGRHPDQVLDLYLPKVDNPKIPIVYVYGSAWRKKFEKADFVFVAQALTSLGHPVILPEHRRYPDVKFPVFIEDIADAISYVERHNIGLAKPFNEFVLMGHSSGAHTAALLATDQRYFKQRRINATLKGLIAMSGPYDLPMNDAEVAPIFKTTAKQAKPVLNVRRGMPPTLLLHGMADTRVPAYHAERFRDALRSNGNAVTTRLYRGVDHEKLIGGVAEPLRFLNNSFADIRAFLRRH